MNKNLKAAIIKKYGHQYLFACDLKIRGNEVSKVINGKRQLDPENQKIWADILDVKVEEIFTE